MAVDPGAYSIVASVTNDIGTTASESFTWTIEEPVGGNEFYHDFTTKTLGGFSHYRASLSTAINEGGSLVEYTTDQPAWDRGNGLQIEGAATNVQPWSQKLDEGGWSDVEYMGAPVRDGVTGPNGSASWRLTPLETDIWHLWLGYPIGIGNSKVYAISYTVKSLPPPESRWLELSGYWGFFDDTWSHFDMKAGVWGASQQGSSLSFKNQRISSEVSGFFTASRRTTSVSGYHAQGHNYVGAVPDDNLPIWSRWLGSSDYAFLLDRAQVEEGQYATSYITTVGDDTSATRSKTYLHGLWENLGQGLPPGGVVNDVCGQVVVQLGADWEDLADGDVIAMPLCYETGTIDFPVDSLAIIKGSDTAIHFSINVGGVSTTIQAAVVSSSLLVGDSVDFRYRKAALDGLSVWYESTKYNSNISSVKADFSNPIIYTSSTSASTTSQPKLIYKSIRIVPNSVSDAVIEGWA